MRLSVYGLAIGAFVAGMAASPVAAVPMLPQAGAKTRVVVPVDFFGRLLQGNKPHRSKQKARSRKRQPAQVEAQAPAATPGAIPVPLPKPEQGKTEPPDTAEPLKAATAPVPVPVPIPAPAEKPEPASEAASPAPDQKGSGEAKGKTELNPDQKPSKNESQPQGEPAGTGQSKEGAQKPPETGKLPDDAEDQPELVHEDPEALKQCLADLKALGARLEETTPIDEGNGCGIEKPVKVTELLPGLSLGGAVMRCETALGLAHWMQATVQPALGIAKPGRRIVRISPGTTFACRLRNNASTGMISEHARGNGFDVAGFTFDNGDTLEIKPRQDDHTMEGAFQKAVTAGACLYFTTVLAPGSDAAHETHMHLDVKERKNGYRICEGS